MLNGDSVQMENQGETVEFEIAGFSEQKEIEHMDAPSYLNSIQVGSLVIYRLRTSQLPIKPDRHWHGKVEAVSRSTANAAVGVCWVEVLDEGYEGMEEYVLFDQIIEVH